MTFFASVYLSQSPSDGHLPREMVARAVGSLFIFSSPINLAGGSVAWSRTKTKQSRSGICGGGLPARLISEYCAGKRESGKHSARRAPWVRYRVTRSYSMFGARRVNDAIAIQCQSDRITDTIPAYFAWSGRDGEARTTFDISLTICRCDSTWLYSPPLKVLLFRSRERCRAAGCEFSRRAVNRA